MDNRVNRKSTKKKSSVIVAAYLAVMLSLVIGTTFAFLTDKTDTVKNELKPSEVTTEVDEDLDGKTKSNVRIKNTGDVKGYIRAKVIVTWQDAQGNVYAEVPQEGADKDYTIAYDLENGWKKSSDGFYYWTEPVKSVDEDANDCYTGVLISSCTALTDKSADGYFLNLEIIGSGIQSVPTSVVTTEWSSGVSGVNGTTLQIK